uniref:AP2/ERF domain-containing protein n=1 Tax=Euplotes harpa TaxID=151035 RepID=A0A7S3N4K7_9SPIT|mmetsp:Transcript_10588/g.11897  ORF Transcript_10588/g.11897 Transcript_10588/m.11897 type:complete len:137 (+) Transcript_10588:261-671(+)
MGLANRRVSIHDMSLSLRLSEFINILNSMNCDASSVVVLQKKKHDRRRASARRSRFIGVSKNGPSWQAMITVNRRKTYIGTYKTERDAAIAFDFYSMLVHRMEGKTNFSYTKEQLWQMVGNFSDNNQVLDVYQLGF